MNRKRSWFLLFITIFLVLCGGNVEAKEGDLYEQHKKYFDDNLSDTTLEYVKKYDYANNNFSCGKWDFMCHLETLTYKWNIGAIKGLYTGVENFVIKPNDIIYNSEFGSYIVGFRTIAWTLLAVILLWQTIRLYTLKIGTTEPEDVQESLQQKIILTFVAGILMGIYTMFFEWVLVLQNAAVVDVMRSGVKTKEIVIAIFVNGADYGLFMPLILTIISIVYAIAFMYRFVLFGLLYVTGLAAIPTMLNDEYNYFAIWLRLIITNCITLVIQTLCFALGMTAMVRPGRFFLDGTDFLVGIAFCILAIMVPALLGNLGSSSGTSRLMGSVGRFMTRRRWY